MSDLEEILRGVARAATKAAQCSGEDCWGEVNRVLRESLLPLLKAGQAEFDRNIGEYQTVFCDEWRAAKAAIREAVRR